MATLVNNFGEKTTYGDLQALRDITDVTLLLRDQMVQGVIADLAADEAEFFSAPYDGVITEVGVTLHGALTTANCVVSFATDEATPLTFVTMTGGAVTCVQASSGAGSAFSSPITALGTVQKGRAIRALNASGTQDANVAGTVWAVVRRGTAAYLDFAAAS